MRCDDCRHWEPEPESYRAIKGIGECTKAVELWETTEWTKDESGEDSYCDRTVKAEYIDQMSFVQDGSDYSASLWTKPEFFCAHYDPELEGETP